MTVALTNPIIDVFDFASDTLVSKSSMTLDNGHEIAFATGPGLAFGREEFKRRYEVVQADMRARGLDALLVRSPENICYISGYESPGYYKYHCIVITPDQDPVFVIRSFEVTNVPEFTWITKAVMVNEIDHPPTITGQLLQELGLDGKRIGVEKQGFYYTVDEHETLGRMLPKAQFVDAIEVLWDARMIKSEAEIAMMRRSSDLVDTAMRAGWEASVPGASADHISAVVNKTLFENGGEYMGLPPFVLAGPRSCLPHQTGGREILADNDVMFFEISASQRRYTCARMYTIFTGKPPAELIDCANALIGGVNEALEFVRPGRTAQECDRHVRKYIGDLGFGEHYRNRLGYSIGISFPPDWGEGEIIALREGEHRELKPGMTFHMPPTYLKYRDYGLGFSESIVITESGCEKFSSIPLEVVIRS